jgi:hypothetical protein
MQEVIQKTGGSTAADVCHEAATVNASARLEDAADLIVRRKVHRLAVVDGAGRCVGIISRGDILKATLQVRAVAVAVRACVCACVCARSADASARMCAAAARDEWRAAVRAGFAAGVMRMQARVTAARAAMQRRRMRRALRARHALWLTRHAQRIDASVHAWRVAAAFVGSSEGASLSQISDSLAPAAPPVAGFRRAPAAARAMATWLRTQADKTRAALATAAQSLENRVGLEDFALLFADDADTGSAVRSVALLRCAARAGAR